MGRVLLWRRLGTLPGAGRRMRQDVRRRRIRTATAARALEQVAHAEVDACCGFTFEIGAYADADAGTEAAIPG